MMIELALASRRGRPFSRARLHGHVETGDRHEQTPKRADRRR